uniref:Uncharacterized protein n=1 Tax=Panagrolaimus superbus TaxID=310955 RepID=A0A914XQR8_9BILA
MYTGMILSLMEGAGAIGHLAAPFFVGLIVKHGQTNEWSIVFGMIVLVNIFGGIVFLRYGTAGARQNVPQRQCLPKCLFNAMWQNKFLFFHTFLVGKN